MTLISCVECDKLVSHKAKFCPNCGNPKIGPEGIGRVVYIVVSMVLFVSFAMPSAFYFGYLSPELQQYDLAVSLWYYSGLLLAIALTYQRFKNASLNPWLSLLLVFPFINLIIFVIAATRAKVSDKIHQQATDIRNVIHEDESQDEDIKPIYFVLIAVLIIGMATAFYYNLSQTTFN